MVLSQWGGGGGNCNIGIYRKQILKIFLSETNRQKKKLNLVWNCGNWGSIFTLFVGEKVLPVLFLSGVSFIGETSSGKSSIVNEILGEKVLPTDISATTTRVCRIRYSEKLVVSVRDKNDKEDLERIPFSNIEEMTKKIKTLAKTEDPDKRYVDIFMQLPFTQVHVQCERKKNIMK